jgi:hypothetical protein
MRKEVCSISMFILTLVEETDRDICIVRMETDISPRLPHNCGLLHMSKHEWLVLAGLMTLGARQAGLHIDVTITDYLYNRRLQGAETGNDSTELQRDHIESHRHNRDGQRECQMADMAVACSTESSKR